MVNYEDYFCGMTEEEYEKQSEEHIKYLEQLNKCNYEKAERLLEKYKDNLFSSVFISDEEAEMLYYTILNWKEKSEIYDDLCE